MQIAQNSALLRALSSCAEFLRATRRIPAVRGTAPPPLTDHVARDIGLTDHQRLVLSYRWPSQDMVHPNL